MCVDHGRRGCWEISLPDQPERVACETFEEAQRVAYRCAAQRSPCEVVVHDAYHRTVRHELVDSKRGS